MKPNYPQMGPDYIELEGDGSSNKKKDRWFYFAVILAGITLIMIGVVIGEHLALNQSSADQVPIITIHLHPIPTNSTSNLICNIPRWVWQLNDQEDPCQNQ